MDHSYHMEQGLGDYLHQNRSTVVTLTESRFDPLNATEATGETSSTGNTPSSTSVPSLATNFSSESEGSPFLACPAPKSFTPHPLSVIDQNWRYLESPKALEAPILRLEEPQETAVTASDSAGPVHQNNPIFNQEDMSTLGVQFDPQFDAVTRTSYSWPLFDMNEPYQNQEIGGLDPFNLSNTVSPYAKSLSSSPPQPMFTPEQRELKRQRDLARRESKTKQRRDRSTSNSYTASQKTTPDLIPRTLVNFSSTMAPSSLPAETSPTFANTTYIPSLAPQMSSSESPELFGAPFPLISNDYGVGAFMMPFSSATEQSMPSYSSRPHSLSSASDQPYFYRNSPVTAQDSQDTVRVVHSRPKPQCWDHGCNGRQFSTFSNLLRHQREKSGVSSKPSCPKCGAEFTRTTARNGHMAHEKCKQRRNSNH